ncbi:MAG TPA: 6-pyruvoyl-tetrahydropterin synthase-related protein [Candidatus Limnocylindria bacterium]|nr:6-pyruvoyl-tetrahydropterin synthase-related protein [Candidatus Limnocylindria bacterium]
MRYRLRTGPERAVALALVTAPMALLAVWLWPELTVRVPSTNDQAFHHAFVRRAAEALAGDGSPLDLWVPQFAIGFPEFLYYQNLPHVGAAAVARLTQGALDAYAALALVRYALLVSLPLTVFWSLRTVGASAPGSALAAAAAALLSTDHLYGFDLGSYVWRGYGMYTQLWAMHLTFIALAGVWRLLERGRGYAVAIASVAALALSHQLYAYMAAITSAVAVLVAPGVRAIPIRAARLGVVGIAAALVASYFLVPSLLTARTYLEISGYLQPEKYDSFGAPQVLTWLVQGALFDHGRLPVVTALVAGGAAVALVRRRRWHIFALALFALWLVLYFGRPTLGPLTRLLPLADELYFHRFISGVHVAGVLLVAALGDEVAARARVVSWSRAAIAAAVLALVLSPAVSERRAYLALNDRWMRQTSAAVSADADAERVLARIERLGPGRAHAGLRDNWGATMDFGIPFRSVKMTHLLAFRGIPEVAPPYAGPSLNADLMFHFDFRNAAHYDLFNARYVVAPTGQAMPDFLRRLDVTSRYALYEAPTSGYGGYVGIAARRAAADQRRLFEANREWLLSPGPAARGFIRWDYPAERPAAVDGRPACADGTVGPERIAAEWLEVRASCPTASPFVLKITYHPNWRVWVDGVPTPTYMLSPSLIGIDLPPGEHLIFARYEPTAMKLPLLALGLVVLASAVVGRRALERADARIAAG